MLRTGLRLLVLGLVAHALWRITPVYWRYLTFRDGAREIAQFSAGHDEDEVRDRIVDLSGALGVPLRREAVSVRREGDRTYVDASYVEELYWLPRTAYLWTFRVGVEAWHVRPPTLSDIVPK